MTYDIPTAKRGDTWDGINSICISVNGIPANLTGASIKADFRQKVDTPTVLTLSTNNGGIVITNPTGGLIQFPPKKIEIPFGTYIYDLQVTYPNGVVKTYFSGTWTITPDITE
jgi:hypothetical protein